MTLLSFISSSWQLQHTPWRLTLLPPVKTIKAVVRTIEQLSNSLDDRYHPAMYPHDPQEANQQVSTDLTPNSGTSTVHDTLLHSDELRHRILHPDILVRICQNASRTQLATLMRTSKTCYEIAGQVLYRDLTLKNIHECKPATPLMGLPVGTEIGWRGAHCVPNAEERTSGRKEVLLAHTRVLRLPPGVCDRGIPRPDGFVSFPNLRTLHKTEIEPCESRDPDTMACHIFEYGKSPHLHTLVFRNTNLASTWEQYCRPGWGADVWSSVKRIVFVYSSAHPAVQHNFLARSQIRDGSSLEAFNVVLLPISVSPLGDNPYQPFDYSEPQTRANKLVKQLLEICSSNIPKIIIAGAETIGKLSSLEASPRGGGNSLKRR